MADAYTTTASVGLDQAAYDRYAHFALRPELMYDLVADVMPTRQSMPGTSVSFTKIADMAVASTALNESVDVDAQAMSDSQLVVTLVEYGNAIITTAKLRATSFIDIDPITGNVIGFNAGRSVDSVVQGVLQGGSNVRYSGQAVSRATVIPTDKLVAANSRRALAELRGANVSPTKGNLYSAYIHPDVAYDLKGETGEAGWLAPHVYSEPNPIFTSIMGSFNGFEWIETPRAPVFADAGSSTTLTDTYRTLFLGRQALAKGFSTTDGNGAQPRVMTSPVVDHLRRFAGLSWYHFVGYARFREEAIRAVESSSTIGTNA
jgi:N4-gp56 family major capsid protein